MSKREEGLDFDKIEFSDNKDSLELQDIKQQAKTDDVYTSSDISVTESQNLTKHHK